MKCFWHEPPKEIRLHRDQVHVYCLELDWLRSKLQNIQALLSPDEMERAHRYHFEIDQRRFILRRGFLRQLLGAYLRIAPSQIRFSVNEYGKPALDSSLNAYLRFNLSFSEDLVLFAIAYEREVGVDVERVRSDFEIDAVARRFFSTLEQSFLRKLPHHHQAEAFFCGWTRKEAYLKAHGRGLSLPLDQFDVSLLPGEPAKLLATRHAPADVQRWRMLHLEPAPGYVAALVVEGGNWNASCWRLIN